VSKFGRTTTRMSAVGNASHIGKVIHRTAERPWSRLLIGELQSCDVHGHERIEIKIGVNGECVRVVFRDGLRGRRKSWKEKQAQSQRNRVSHSVPPLQPKLRDLPANPRLWLECDRQLFDRSGEDEV
jgi:hypothetical protein